MAYRRYGRKRFRGRGRRRRGGNSMWNLAKKAASGVVKYYLNPEYKFLDYDTGLTISNTGTVLSGVNLIATGDDSTNRDGNSIKITSWLLRWSCTINASATSTRFRIVIVTDTASHGAVPAVTDILESASTLSPLNKTNGSRFTPLYDRMFALDADDPMKVGKIYKKMQHHIHYLNNTAATTSLGQGPIYVLAISSEATNVPSFSINNRFRFLDN